MEEGGFHIKLMQLPTKVGDKRKQDSHTVRLYYLGECLLIINPINLCIVVNIVNTVFIVLGPSIRPIKFAGL